MTPLLDTDAQVSIMSHTWKDSYLPDLQIRPMSETVEEKEKLKVYAVTGELIPFERLGPLHNKSSRE